jgi:surfeit locus 1 family protein
MIRRIPIFPTLLVLAAVAVMVRLGFWQLDRLGQKEALLTRFAAASSNSDEMPFPSFFQGQRGASGNWRFPVMKTGVAETALYRRSRVDCRSISDWQAKSGSNAKGENGWAHIALCEIEGNRAVYIVAGWSRASQTPTWGSGLVTGVISPGGPAGARLVADPPLAGLEANAKPDPSNIPNNHLAYAVQWFLFALTALVIYALALRKRLAAPGGEG